MTDHSNNARPADSTNADATLLHGHVALVTGSSRGLGKVIARRLGALGAKVAVNCAHDGDAGRRACAELEPIAPSCTFVQADVTDADAVSRLVETVRDRLGPIDILVINATCDQPRRPIEEYDWATYQEMIDCFIRSPYLLTRACVGDMKAKRWGRIVNIGSEVFHRGPGRFSAYVSAKGGQYGWTRSMATELAPFGITVNIVSPGWIPVERHARADPAKKAAYLASIPAGRWGVPEDVAATVAFLTSDGASFVTGQDITINGGLTVG